MRSNRRTTRSPLRAGTVLIVTIWVVLVVAGLTLVFGRSMRVAAIAAANQTAAQQAETIAAGAMAYVLAQLQSDEEAATLESAVPWDAMQVGDGYFWVLRSNLQDDREQDYGITDESAKINLNSASLEMLLKLPDMTAELAASIIDWRDSDSEISDGGAEDEYYLLLPEPYNCKNGPFETVEEVLIVKDASPEILFGEDTNRNGVLDDNENDGDENPPDDNRNGRLDGGFYEYVTVYSMEANVDTDGRQRLNVNDLDNEELVSLLRETVGDDAFFQMMPALRSEQRRRSFNSVLAFYVASGMELAQFETIVDRLTTSDEETLMGTVNVNTAPREVLLCLPGLEESDVDALIQTRQADSTNLDNIAWVAGVLDSEKAAAVGGQITARSFQHSADIVSIAGNGRAYCRRRVVFDTRQQPPRVVFCKTLTHMGWPLDTEIVAALRRGESLTQASLGTN